MKAFQFVVLAVAVACLNACDSDNPAGPGDPQITSVTGQVTNVKDDTPVDGGVVITIRAEQSPVETLSFGSLFMAPPPSPEKLALYDKIRVVRAGDKVRASGWLTDTDLELVDIEVLSPF